MMQTRLFLIVLVLSVVVNHASSQPRIMISSDFPPNRGFFPHKKRSFIEKAVAKVIVASFYYLFFDCS
jgi:hypothetical protein